MKPTAKFLGGGGEKNIIINHGCSGGDCGGSGNSNGSSNGDGGGGSGGSSGGSGGSNKHRSATNSGCLGFASVTLLQQLTPQQLKQRSCLSGGSGTGH